MKFLVVFTVFALVACQAIAAPVEEKEAEAVVAASVEDLAREQRSYGAAPSYSAPAPAYAPAASYAPARLGPAKSYSYASPAPTIPCGQALVFSCAPSVAQAPCAASQGYAAPSYGGGY